MRIKAILLAVGDAEAYGGFFSAGWDYLNQQLAQLGVSAVQGQVLDNDPGTCGLQLGGALREHRLAVILTAPQPRAATMVAAVLAKGLGLGLSHSAAAEQCVFEHCQKVGLRLSPQEMVAFSTQPDGAAALKNPHGLVQGYAISSQRQLLLVLPASPSELMNVYESYVSQLVAQFSQTQQPAVHTPATPSQVASSRETQNARSAAPRNEADTVLEVCNSLVTAGLTVAVAESGTSGALAQSMSSCRSSAFSERHGFSGRDQLNELAISSQLLSQHGPVSPQAATALAKSALEKTGCRLGVAITCGKNRQGATVAYMALTDGIKSWCRAVKDDSGVLPQLRLTAVLNTLGLLRVYALNGSLEDEATPTQSTALVGVGAGGIKSRFLGILNPKAAGAAVTTEEGKGDLAKKTNLLQRLKAGKLTSNDKVRLIAVFVFLAVFIGSIIYIVSVYKESADNKRLSEDLRQLIDGGEVSEEMLENYPGGYLPKFAALYAQNEDIAGWIKLPGTQIDYPVVQFTDNAYYERRDFTRKDNQHGVPFVDFRTDQREQSANTIIYAHNMNDGQMFGELLNYKSLNYYKEHPVITYDSVYREGQYKIFGVVLCKKDDPEFDYHNFIDAEFDEDMVEYVTKIRERSLINTNVDVRTNDKLLTLSTCDYTFKSNTGDRIARFVVFARKVRDGEDATVDVSKATLNLNPILPQEWYDKLAKQQEAERLKAESEAAASSSSSQSTADANKWLFSYELSDLDAEGQKRLAEQRQADAKTYLTSDEQATMGLQEMLDKITERQELFGLYLSYDEQELASLSKRLSLMREHRAEAQQWLSQDEIYSAGSWDRIQELIIERKGGQVTNPNAKWLTDEENQTLSASKKNELIAQRQKMARDAGLSNAQINSVTTWAEMEALIEQASSGSGDAAANQLIAQNPKWLDSGDKGLSVDELKSLMAYRKDLASAAGINAGSYSTWSSMQRAINAARDSLFSASAPWVNSSDRALDYIDLSSRITQRKKQATDAGVTAADVAGSKSWDETSVIIANKQNAGNAGAYFQQNYPRWLTDGDKNLALADMKSKVESRQRLAAQWKVDGNSYATWGEIDAAIQAAMNAGSGSGTTNPSNPSSGSGGSGGSGSATTPPPDSGSGSNTTPSTPDSGSGSNTTPSTPDSGSGSNTTPSTPDNGGTPPPENSSGGGEASSVDPPVTPPPANNEGAGETPPAT